MVCPRPLVLCLKAAEASEAFRMLVAGLPACHTRSTDPGTPLPPQSPWAGPDEDP